MSLNTGISYISHISLKVKGKTITALKYQKDITLEARKRSEKQNVFDQQSRIIFSLKKQTKNQNPNTHCNINDPAGTMLTEIQRHKRQIL